MFAQLNTIDGCLETRYSKGSCTPDFLRENFVDAGPFHDTVYVTANPMYRDELFSGDDLPGSFHATVDVWATAWDDTHGTIQPEAVADAAVEAIQKYPDKRHLVHFMQPHRPFIGDTGKEIDAQRGMATRGEVLDTAHSRAGERAWKLVDQDKLSPERAWRAYCENLEVALPYVQRVVDAHDGRRIVTSDHGNLVNEPRGPLRGRESGHPPRTWVEELVRIPWLVVEDGTRRAIVSEPPEVEVGQPSSNVQERLSDLGYV